RVFHFILSPFFFFSPLSSRFSIFIPALFPLFLSFFFRFSPIPPFPLFLSFSSAQFHIFFPISFHFLSFPFISFHFLSFPSIPTPFSLRSLLFFIFPHFLSSNTLILHPILQFFIQYFNSLSNT